MFQGSYIYPKTGRYFSLREVTGDEDEIWIVLHGYKQLANFFLKKFNTEIPPNINLIAPEGMHRFYLEGYRGRVGASWMTSEERDADISDYTGALDILVTGLLEKFQVRPKINVLGFSQGAATATRWVCRGKTEVNQLVLWAGSFPPDIDFSGDFDILRKLNLKLVLGDKDEFFKDDYIVNLRALFDDNRVSYKIEMYDGNHDIHMDTFLQLLNT